LPSVGINGAILNTQYWVFTAIGKHSDKDSLEFINWLKSKGESLGYIAELEYPLVEKEYFVDVVWKFKKEQTPLMTFEV